jgi:hypothetical protein
MDLPVIVPDFDDFELDSGSELSFTVWMCVGICIGATLSTLSHCFLGRCLFAKPPATARKLAFGD